MLLEMDKEVAVTNEFFEDRMYCERCNGDVPYLRSLDASYCVYCDQEVTIVSRAEMQRILEEVHEEGAFRHLWRVPASAGAPES